MSLHSVTEPRGFLTGTLPLCVVLIPCRAWMQTTRLLKFLCEGDCEKLSSLHEFVFMKIQQYVEEKREKLIPAKAQTATENLRKSAAHTA